MYLCISDTQCTLQNIKAYKLNFQNRLQLKIKKNFMREAVCSDITCLNNLYFESINMNFI